MDQFVGQILAVGFNFAPVGWLLCDGSTVPISQYDVLYNLLGTTFGGNGTTTFGLPDLRGRSPLGVGVQSGGPTYLLGAAAGVESVTLAASQNAAHSHPLIGSTAAATAPTPNSSMVLGPSPSTVPVTAYAASPNTTLLPASVGLQGGSQPHENRQPYNTVNYIIAYVGVYPSQS